MIRYNNNYSNYNESMRVIYFIFHAENKLQISLQCSDLSIWKLDLIPSKLPARVIKKTICVDLVLGQRPTLESVPNHGLCDIRQQDCMRIRVTGNAFIDNQKLSCKMAAATVSNLVSFNIASIIQFMIIVM